MKKSFVIRLALLSVLLSSCGQTAPRESSSETSSASSTEESLSSSSVEGATTSSSSQEEGSKVYHFYCVNDFHGAILERNDRYYEAGIAKYFGKLKELKENDPEHTIILSAGDMFQGSLESNSNFGQLITTAMNDVGFDAMTLGNHEFDYGQEHLLDIIEFADFPILGGNIMKYVDGPTSTPWQPDLVKPSTIVEKDGAKIGIVGMIGEGQTTSITSTYVEDITFVDPTSIAKAEALRLREEEGCQIVVLVSHTSADDTLYASDKDYFDGVFCGHSHDKEVQKIDGVPLVQSYCNGEAISHFTLTLSQSSCVCASYGVLSASGIWEENAEIAAIRDYFIEEPTFKEKAYTIAGTISGTLYAKEGIANISCKAIYEKYSEEVEGLACAMVNGQRAHLSGEITYSDICRATPFLNKVIILEVSGQDILSEGQYNCSYTEDIETYGKLVEDEFYKIAVIDYLAFHQNVNKTYNYFYSLNPGRGGRVVAEYPDHPFDLVYDYIKNDLGGNVIASEFNNGSPGFGIYA